MEDIRKLVLWRAGVTKGAEGTWWWGRGEKWVKPEGNKVQKVQLGPEVPSSPRCLPGSAVTGAQGRSVGSVQGSCSVGILDTR